MNVMLHRDPCATISCRRHIRRHSGTESGQDLQSITSAMNLEFFYEDVRLFSRERAVWYGNALSNAYTFEKVSWCARRTDSF